MAKLTLAFFAISSMIYTIPEFKFLGKFVYIPQIHPHTMRHRNGSKRNESHDEWYS